MTNNSLSVGSVVKLKSGGPLMTVVEIEQASPDGTDQAYCTWFSSSDDTNYGTFPSTALRVYDDAELN